MPGRLVSEETRNVSYRDHAATEFHIQNSSGFPDGEYTVEILVDGQSFATRIAARRKVAGAEAEEPR